MNALSKEYLLLFNTLTDTAQRLEQLRQKLLLSQQMAEAMFILQETADEPAAGA